MVSALLLHLLDGMHNRWDSGRVIEGKSLEKDACNSGYTTMRANACAAKYGPYDPFPAAGRNTVQYGDVNEAACTAPG